MHGLKWCCSLSCWTPIARSSAVIIPLAVGVGCLMSNLEGHLANQYGDSIYKILQDLYL